MLQQQIHRLTRMDVEAMRTHCPICHQVVPWDTTMAHTPSECRRRQLRKLGIERVGGIYGEWGQYGEGIECHFTPLVIARIDDEGITQELVCETLQDLVEAGVLPEAN